MAKKLSIIVVSASSDIGAALCQEWLQKGWNVYGTYRSFSPDVEQLEQKGVRLVHLDAADENSLKEGCRQLKNLCPKWDALIFGIGTLEPVGLFYQMDFQKWQKGFNINFLNQLHILHELLPHRNLDNKHREPAVLFFAGGGTNNAVSNNSSYMISKVALIKMCEFLDLEMPDTRFVIVGPGWVKTKIHKTIMAAGPAKAGDNFYRTLKKWKSSETVPMQKVVDCCSWLITTSSKGVRGRNFSAAFDPWQKNRQLESELEKDPDMYKLRRHKNEWGRKLKSNV